ncbi:hypothetical protein CERZMDRAFT_101184 [Cercospora zeae-maydis SCOH1-5]|uniref:BZIP domain-containing protein n=1 Tax=Cercospora zeae-maydis SCOH1-5 TaxID=717836 RepID=A0A6A6F7Q2_9PEZI|nr:hypothetical protein CERZMDRAFT_101184 [Cercospora zeae-maydis SCOH1-5]
MADGNEVQFQQALQLQQQQYCDSDQADLDMLESNQFFWNNEFPFGQPQDNIDDSWTFLPQHTPPMLLPPQIQQPPTTRSEPRLAADAGAPFAPDLPRPLVARQSYQIIYPLRMRTISPDAHGAMTSTPSTPETNDESTDYINYEAQQHQQHVTAPGFRAYDEPQRSASVKHERVDSVGSNGAGNKVAIPKNGSISSLKRKASEELSPTQSADAGMTAARSGPMSTDITIPARPRPGRKPLGQENAVDRRRVQNRLAQRNFRDKRAQKNVELEGQIAVLKTTLQQQDAQYRNTIAQLNAQSAEKDRAIAELKAEVDALRTEITEKDKRIADLDAKLRANTSVEQGDRGQAGHTSVHEPSNGPTPPSSEYEIDFTNYGRGHNPSVYTVRDVLNDSNGIEFTVDNEDPCGFCTDDQNCACKQEQQRQRPKPVPMEPRITTMPGSCDMCRSDPERARACREMAAQTRTPSGENPHTIATQSTMSTPSSSTSMPPPRMSCSAMLDQFNKYGQRTSTIRDLFGGRPLNAYPRESGGGFDFEEKQAAEVLSTLARRSTGAESASSFASSQ